MTDKKNNWKTKDILGIVFILLVFFTFFLPHSATAGTVDVFRLYNRNTSEHFYTSNPVERDKLINVGWNDEGIGWSAPTDGTPVYRLYNPNAVGGDHHYTTSTYEKDFLVKQGWKYDGSFFNSGGNIPVYVAYNPKTSSGAHNFTTNRHEQNSLLSNGWMHDKEAWKASSVGQAPPIRSKSVLIADNTGKILEGKNMEQRLPIASVSKLIILARVQEAVKSGKLKWSNTYEVTPALAGKNLWGSLNFAKGEKYTLAEYYFSALMPSSNPGAIMLGIILDGNNSNALKNTREWLNKIGIKGSTYMSVSGLEAEDLVDVGMVDGAQNANLFSAKDLLSLLMYIKKNTPAVFADAQGASTIIHGVTYANHSTVFYKNSIISGKSGYTPDASNCFAGITSSGKFVVVLGAPSASDVNTDTGALMQLK